MPCCLKPPLLDSQAIRQTARRICDESRGAFYPQELTDSDLLDWLDDGVDIICRCTLSTHPCWDEILIFRLDIGWVAHRSYKYLLLAIHDEGLEDRLRSPGRFQGVWVEDTAELKDSQLAEWLKTRYPKPKPVRKPEEPAWSRLYKLGTTKGRAA